MLYSQEEASDKSLFAGHRVKDTQTKRKACHGCLKKIAHQLRSFINEIAECSLVYTSDVPLRMKPTNEAVQLSKQHSALDALLCKVRSKFPTF
jgi:hypothetical protein